MFGRTKIAMVVAEFLGVATLTLVTLAVSKSGVGFSYFIAGGVGLAMALLVLMIGRASAGHYNPGVTVGLWSTRKIETTTAVAYIAAQFLGALAAWKLFVYVTDQTLQSVATGQFDWRVLTAEAVGAFVFAFGVAAAIYQRYVGLRWAATVGGALFVGMILAATGANGLINPAVAFGVQSWNKVYVLGPLVGGIVGVNLYAMLFAPAGAWNSRVSAAARSVVTTRSTSRPAAARKTTTRKTTAKRATTARKRR